MSFMLLCWSTSLSWAYQSVVLLLVFRYLQVLPVVVALQEARQVFLQALQVREDLDSTAPAEAAGLGEPDVVADVEVVGDFGDRGLGLSGGVRVLFPEVRQVVDAEVELEPVDVRQERQTVHLHVALRVPSERFGSFSQAARRLFLFGTAGFLGLAAGLGLLVRALLLAFAASLAQVRQTVRAAELFPGVSLAVEAAFVVVDAAFSSLLVEELDGLEVL